MSNHGKHSSSGQYGQNLGVCLLVFFLLLTGCSPLTTRQEDPFQPRGAFSASGQEQLPEQWWLTFEDQTLNSLINRALAGNFDLQTAWDRVDRADALARKAGAAFVPQVDGELGVSTQRSRINSRIDWNAAKVATTHLKVTGLAWLQATNSTSGDA